MKPAGFLKVLIIIPMIAVTASCSIKQMAMKSIANSLSSGSSVFQSETDPELVGDALPFALMMYEIVLEERPDDPPLLLAASRAYTMYSYGFLMVEAEMIDKEDFGRAMRMRRRATGLFIRAKEYALRGLEVRHPGFRDKLHEDYKSALAAMDESDVAYLYWCGVSWAAALSAAKDDLVLLSELPTGAAMVERVVEINDGFGDGAAHDFFVSYYGSRPEAMGGSIGKAREHFRRSIELSGGSNAGTYVAMATSVSVRTQDVGEFRALLEKALKVDLDRYPENRLSNLIMQRRARWLLENTDDFFLGE